MPFAQTLLAMLSSSVMILSVSGVGPGTPGLGQSASLFACQPASPLVRIPGLPEASGLAASARTRDLLWAINDSGKPELVALDTKGTVLGRVRLDGASVEDWEAVAIGRCPAGSCIHVADIGDNGEDRQHITVYRAVEPGDTAGAVTVTGIFHASYPDGPQDAEALLVSPDGGLFIVTKGEKKPSSIYRFPADLRSGAMSKLERVGKPRDAGREAEPITDGSFSPDGASIVLRSTGSLAFYRSNELLGGNWEPARRIDLTPLGEPQGEGVAFGADKVVYVVGEGGGQARGGSFGGLTCPAP